MQVNHLLQKALQLEWLTIDEGAYLFNHAPTAALANVGNLLRKHHKRQTPNIVTWIIDRNVNTTNVCVANCKFCNFFVPPTEKHAHKAYITDMDTYRQKIAELYRFGGEQLLLQGGHHPDLGLSFYTNLFATLKSEFPDLKLHALGPPEIHHIATLGGHTYQHVLQQLIAAGLDSFPGAGAEILVDRVRRIIAQGKCNSNQWFDVMRQAHKLGLTTSATMMFGTVETIEERMEHLARVREVQAEKPSDAVGFLAFIPWPYQDEGTTLQRVRQVNNDVTGDEYVRMVALSRIMLPNVENIQASWLTVGRSIAQICLHAGANDFGSIMIEENVVSAAGAPHRFTASGIQQAIREAGFTPQLRNQHYQFRTLPNHIEDQVVAY
ncbi:MAG: CofH family radical SAM protein [Sphingobacteriales bacterium]|jgi:cyclic dehypoxanthinyl futalosine synthase|nr:CofH family radical SAM protein [Sphingobacteriales bacterium]MBP9142706.1 CofH family radical SAM protein [Chitinophagales bacterium]MDA0198198.1 CofH family radical SAM protein [Bacteroidota bacterium]MBK6890624.1 CofH family radical SAM protein [Sphingobacteriales bacterium]MBK7526322.1 CofH family radical SAM protein [Sphingobacteriales bacterium]